MASPQRPLMYLAHRNPHCPLVPLPLALPVCPFLPPNSLPSIFMPYGGGLNGARLKRGMRETCFWYWVCMGGGWMERGNLAKTVTPKWTLSSLKLVLILFL